jgi:Cu/Ag efflux protein CusF
MTMRTMKKYALIPGMALLLGASIAVSVPPEVSAGTPCCSITAVDRKTGIVTAKNTETGETFKFRLGDAAQIGNVKAGDQVSADFKTRQVTVHSFQPVEGILMRTPRPRPPIR